jgi:hypothetical protein
MNTGTINGVSYSFFIERLFVRQHQEAPNAVARVEWVCVLTRGNGKVLAGGRTDLNAPNPTAFTNIVELEAAQVIAWAIEKQGGQAWLEQFMLDHEEFLAQAELDADLEGWHIPLVNPLKFDPQNV